MAEWAPKKHHPCSSKQRLRVLLYYIEELLFMVCSPRLLNLTSYMTRTMLGVILFFCIKNTKKKLGSKSVRSFYKAISKNLEFGCNAWPKSNIYNISNNIKLVDPVGLAAIPDPTVLDAGLTVRSCHKSVIIK